MKTTTSISLLACVVLLAVVKQSTPSTDAAKCFRWVCGRPPHPGPCYAHQYRYFYEPSSDHCYPFIYGGCRGNLNNFPTKQECMWFCFRRKNPPYVCLLPMNEGNNWCYDAQHEAGEKWYFDEMTGECKKFLYKGCEGSFNRFASEELCSRNCHPLRAEDTLALE